MIDFAKKAFLGGMNQQVDATRLEDNQYPLLINGRNRYDVINPVELPLKISSPIIGNRRIQGIYSVGSILVVFAGGLAFYKDENFPNSNYNQIANFQLSATADIIHAALVPISSINYTRIPATTGQINTDIKLVTPIQASPAGLVCQDGENQPYLINTDMTARRLARYQDWTLDNREYVPIGHHMLYSGGKLYIVNGANIYQSVTGRPLDFIIVIDSTGDKLPDEAQGGATATAFSVDYNNITCISALSTDDNSFYVSTAKTSYAVTPLVAPEDLIFGEPDFIARFLFTAGSTSPFSFVELIGDNAFVDFNGLRSFNAITQLKFEGQNSPFSKKVGPILQGIIQDYTAAINYDNYALFAMNTIYGRGIVVYDTLNEVFTGIDIYPDIGQILKFEEVRTIYGRRLFFATVDGALYEAFAADKTATCKFYLGDYCSNNPDVEQRPWQLKLVFVDSVENGTVNAYNYSDRKLGGMLSATIDKKIDATYLNAFTIPIGQATTDTVQILNFDFTKKGITGWKHGFLIEWNVNAKLTHAKFSSAEEVNISSVTTQAAAYKRNKTALGL